MKRYGLIALEGSLSSIETFLTIDTAIYEAKALSRKFQTAIAVWENSYPPRTVGVARGDVWRWAVVCKTCKGTGRKTVSPTVSCDCASCGRRGWREADAP